MKMELSHQTLQAFAKLIHQWSGLVIGQEKAYLVRHRLEPLVRSCGLESFDDLLVRLRSGGQTRLHNAVIDAITTKETSFFRDSWLFEALYKHVLPACAVRRNSVGGRSRLRIWSAGSSTGQEAYSLGMIAVEMIEASMGALTEHHFDILASDVSEEAVGMAKEGAYSKAAVDRGLSETRLKRHFTRHGDRWVANDGLRRMVKFRVFNLMDSPADLGSFDLVLCRNVMIYFDEPARRRVCRGLHQVLRGGGCLALGSAESLSDGTDLEHVKFGRAVIYRKTGATD